MVAGVLSGVSCHSKSQDRKLGIDESPLLLYSDDAVEVLVAEAFDRFLVDSRLGLAICCPL